MLEASVRILAAYDYYKTEGPPRLQAAINALKRPGIFVHEGLAVVDPTVNKAIEDLFKLKGQLKKTHEEMSQAISEKLSQAVEMRNQYNRSDHVFNFLLSKEEKKNFTEEMQSFKLRKTGFRCQPPKPAMVEKGERYWMRDTASFRLRFADTGELLDETLALPKTNVMEIAKRLHEIGCLLAAMTIPGALGETLAHQLVPQTAGLGPDSIKTWTNNHLEKLQSAWEKVQYLPERKLVLHAECEMQEYEIIQEKTQASWWARLLGKSAPTKSVRKILYYIEGETSRSTVLVSQPLPEEIVMPAGIDFPEIS